ncbi:hypothetical protein [Lyngbya aestuarii]|uniref:hypothetical protein n=1 Tax=Lyngbya aestuarii TaxID=118322 RepID=UPI00403DACA3
MVSTLKAKTPLIRESKISHKSPVLHPLVRFVTEETVALLFDLKSDEIYRIDCWQHVVYVHAKGVSRFVSYADFPPNLEVQIPNPQDFVRWRKRWKNRWRCHQAPEFWTKFYEHQFKNAVTKSKLLDWGKLIACLESSLSIAAVQQLRDAYTQEKYFWDNF